jgi:hypothetical protein
LRVGLLDVDDVPGGEVEQSRRRGFVTDAAAADTTSNAACPAVVWTCGMAASPAHITRNTAR